MTRSWTAFLAKCMTTRMNSNRFSKNVITFPTLKIFQKLSILEVKTLFWKIIYHASDCEQVR